MDIVLIALLGLPLVWMALAPASFWAAALAWQYRDRQRPPGATGGVRATGIIGLVTIAVILAVLIGGRVGDARRVAACERDVVPELTRILEQDRARLDAWMADFGTRQGWTHTTVDGVSTNFRDGGETVVIVQHDPSSSRPVSCY